MKIATNPGSIIAACKLASADFEAQHAKFNAEEMDRRKSWFYRNMTLWERSPVDREAEKRVKDLLAIAKHKGGAGLLELDDPYLSDIAQFLEPWENPRI